MSSSWLLTSIIRWPTWTRSNQSAAVHRQTKRHANRWFPAATSRTSRSRSPSQKCRSTKHWHRGRTLSTRSFCRRRVSNSTPLYDCVCIKFVRKKLQINFVNEHITTLKKVIADADNGGTLKLILQANLPDATVPTGEKWRKYVKF